MAVQQEVEEKTGEVTVTNLKQFLQLILMHKSFQQFYHSGFGRSKRFQATQINQFGLDPQVPAPAKRDTAPGVKKVKMVGDSCIFSKFLLNGPSGLAKLVACEYHLRIARFNGGCCSGVHRQQQPCCFTKMLLCRTR